MEDGTLVSRREALAEATIDGELMGLSIDRGLCFGFNATATEIWRMIDTPQTVRALSESLLARYDVDPATCRADLVAALAGMTEQGLVSLTPAR